MWFFKKSKENLAESGVLNGMTDIHSHVLWGVDDGAKCKEQSITMLKDLQSLGISRTFATPHIKVNLTNNTAESLDEAFQRKLVPLAKKTGMDAQLAAEYMLDERFIKMIRGGERLLTYNGKHILVELSHMGAPLRLQDILFEIQSSGYAPILAHPERYGSFMTVKEYERLKEQGTMLQLNILSLVGVYRQSAQELADELLEAGLYDYVGTDVHNENMVNKIKAVHLSKKNLKRVEKLVQNNNLL